MSGCKVYKMNTKYQTIVLLTLLNVSSHVKYHTCQNLVNCHFVSCIGRCGCTATCQEPGKRMHSHSNAIDIQADVVHQRMPNLSYSVESG